MKSFAHVSTALFATAALGCQPPLTSTWQLTDYRVLGVKVTTPDTADPTRAEPDRGEAFSLSLASADTTVRDTQTLWLLLPVAASPTDLLAGFAAGAGTPSGGTVSTTQLNLLVQLCLAGMLPPMQGLQCAGGASPMFTVPAEGGAPDTSGRESLTAIGFSCAGGTISAAPAADPTAGGDSLPFLCSGDHATGWLFTKTVFVHPPTGDANGPNHNPTITEVRFGNDPGEVAITDDAPPTVPACADQPALNAELNTSSCPLYHFQVAFDAASRESYATTDPVHGGVTTATELLNTGYVVSAGSIDGSFRSDSDTDPMSNMDNAYLAPATPGTVDVYFYVSDSRGGFDWTRRSILVQ